MNDHEFSLNLSDEDWSVLRDLADSLSVVPGAFDWWFPQPKEARMTREMVVKAFQYYPPQPHTKAAYEKLHAAFADIALLVQDLCPESREKSLAITHLQDGRMCANAAIAIHGADTAYTIDGVTHNPPGVEGEPA